MVLYTHSGEQLHAFDFSGSRPQLQQFTIAAACPTGDAFLVGALDCLCSFSMEAAGAAAWRSGPDIHVSFKPSFYQSISCISPVMQAINH